MTPGTPGASPANQPQPSHSTPGAGVTLGAVVSVGATRVLSSVLFGVTAFDRATYGVVALALLLVAGAAGLVPVRRASAIDPVVALRNE